VIDTESEGLDHPIRVTASNLWIAGQTAPAPGIAIRGGILFEGRDFLMQHVGVYRPAQTNRQSDVISFYGTNSGAAPGRAVLDHVAAWGANDGNLDIAHYGGGSVTVQHSIIGPPLIGGHDKGPGHNFNSLVYGSDKGVARLTLRGNLYTTARDRQPLSSFNELIVVNNAYYNREPRRGRYIYLSENSENENATKVSIVGNFFWDTTDDFSPRPVLLNVRLTPASKLYLADNRHNLADPPVPADAWAELVTPNDNLEEDLMVDVPPVWNDCLVAQPSSSVIESVRANVGPRPDERIPFYATLTEELGGEPTHGFPTSLSDIGGELLGMKENRRAFVTPENPHEVEANGYTRLENLLFRMAAEVEGR
jgi:hypothetical protein